MPNALEPFMVTLPIPENMCMGRGCLNDASPSQALSIVVTDATAQDQSTQAISLCSDHDALLRALLTALDHPEDFAPDEDPDALAAQALAALIDIPHAHQN